MIHRNSSNQENKTIKSGFPQRQHQNNRYRYLIDLPEYSAVVENPQSMKNLGRSQASLLQKIVLQNDNIYNSSVFQQNKQKIFDTRVVDQMKFSFNNNQSKSRQLKQSNYNELLTKYQNQYSKATSFNHNNNQFQKKPSKQIIKEQSVNMNIEVIKNKYVASKQYDRKVASKIKIIDQQKEFNDLDSFSKENYVSKIEGGQSQRQLDKAFQKVVIKDKRDQIIPLSKQAISRNQNMRDKIDRQVKAGNTVQKQSLKFQIESTVTPHLQRIFENLDSSKTGKLDKYNCNIKGIKQEFQLIFGLIFYRIKFCNDIFNKKDFINLCLECLKLLKRQKVLSLFKEQDGNQRQKSIKKERQQRECQRILKQKQRMQKMIKEKQEKYKLLIQKEQKELILKQRQQRQKMLKEREERQRRIKELQQRQKLDREERSRALKELNEKQKKIKQQEEQQRKKFIQIKQQVKEKGCQNCKSLSKFSYSILQDSPPKQRKFPDAQQPLNLSKKTNIQVKEIRVQKQTNKNVSNQKFHHTYKYQTNPISSHAFDSLAESKNIMLTKNEEKKSEQLKMAASSKKKRNISQQILREHKKSLNQIHKLNDKVQQYIYCQSQVQSSRHQVRYQEPFAISDRL